MEAQDEDLLAMIEGDGEEEEELQLNETIDEDLYLANLIKQQKIDGVSDEPSNEDMEKVEEALELQRKIKESKAQRGNDSLDDSMDFGEIEVEEKKKKIQ